MPYAVSGYPIRVLIAKTAPNNRREGAPFEIFEYMPRKVVTLSPNDPYHITARCINRDWFKIPLSDVWSLMQDYLYLVGVGFNLRIHSFVLMPNHFHMIVSAPEGNLSSAMLYFMRETSKEITRKANRINQTYGGRYHKSCLSNLYYFMNSYKYVYRNPVRAKICSRVEDYPYSSLSGLLGLQSLVIPVVEDSLLFNPDFDSRTLDWLNKDPIDDLEDQIRRALKHPSFRPSASRVTGKPSSLGSLAY